MDPVGGAVVKGRWGGGGRFAREAEGGAARMVGPPIPISPKKSARIYEEIKSARPYCGVQCEECCPGRHGGELKC